MALMSTAIVAICMGAQGSYNQACNNALDAGTRQAGIRQTADMVESKANDMANKSAEKMIGKEGMSMIGTGAFIFKVARDRSLIFKLPTLGLCNSVTNHITPTSYDITLQWNIK